MPTPLNEEMLPNNTCFGCGMQNPDGLQIRIYRDGDRLDRLVGTYAPRETHEGFPNLVHGGLQFTALDCMAAWLVMAFRITERLMPLTRSASIRYRRPAAGTEELQLSSEVVATEPIAGKGQAQELWKIRTELARKSGELLTAVDFEYVVVPESSFRKMVGIEELPESFRQHFGL